ncbi:MAG: DUF1365 domain-containing protein [Hyphomicrobium sp.]
MASDSAIYAGRVVHKRLRPKQHALDYRVFALLLDVDRIDAIAARCRLFSRNRFNLVSFFDRDHGAGDGASAGDTARRSLKAAGLPHEGRRIRLLTYPRILGYVFNPLSVYFVSAPDGSLESLVYEVSNTFGERKSYVLSAGATHDGGVFAQACAKEMFVSPFASGRGGYLFRVIDPAQTALVAVLLSDGDGALIKTHFRATREELTDRQILRHVARYPLLTLKVIAAIHYEALKLWLKGVPLADRQVSPRYSTTPLAATPPLLNHKQG